MPDAYSEASHRGTAAGPDFASGIKTRLRECGRIDTDQVNRFLLCHSVSPSSANQYSAARLVPQASMTARVRINLRIGRAPVYYAKLDD